jgi:hypothetical protein
MVGQGAPSRTTVAVQVSVSDVSAADSSSAVAALERGLRADSLVEFLHRPPALMPVGRGAQFIVAALVRRVGDAVKLDTRTFNVETSAITVRMSTTSTAATLGDSATAVGRRIALALSAKRP